MQGVSQYDSNQLQSAAIAQIDTSKGNTESCAGFDNGLVPKLTIIYLEDFFCDKIWLCNFGTVLGFGDGSGPGLVTPATTSLDIYIKESFEDNWSRQPRYRCHVLIIFCRNCYIIVVCGRTCDVPNG